MPRPRRPRSSLALAVLLAVACGALACGGSEEAATPDAPATVDAPPTETWTGFAREFTETYCWACHGAGDPLRDYSLLATVRAEQAKIRCGVSPVALAGCTIAPEQFPIGTGPKPGAAERTRFVEWLDAGAAE